MREGRNGTLAARQRGLEGRVGTSLPSPAMLRPWLAPCADLYDDNRIVDMEQELARLDLRWAGGAVVRRTRHCCMREAVAVDATQIAAHQRIAKQRTEVNARIADE